MAIPLSNKCSNQTANSIVRSVIFGGSKHFVVRPFRRADCDSDHYLANAKVKERLSVSKKEAQKLHADRLNRKKLSKMENRK
jgi:hypothetical protein